MLARTRWRVVEEPCEPAEAPALWRAASDRGATGAVTSWGAGIGTRRTLRLYWETLPGAESPEGEDLVEENWTPFWRTSLGIVPVSPRIALVPAWEEAVPEVPIALKIDPGMAFGAGDHATTRLCLRILERVAETRGLPSPVLDVGAGTGVLGLAAAALGASQVDALDIDPFCFAACRRNALLNGFEGRVRPLLLSLDLLPGTYPLVIANMVASQIEALATSLRARLGSGGFLLLSGFEAHAEQGVRALFEDQAVVELKEEEDGWVALLTRHTGAAAALGE